MPKLRKKHLYIKCLKQYHGKGCKTSNCRLCKGYHNTLLHKSKASSTERNNKEIKSSHCETPSRTVDINTQQLVTVTLSADSSIVSLNHCTTKEPFQVLLSIAILFIHDFRGVLHECLPR